MKLFKKALLATAIFGAMGAQAADVSDAVEKTSAEGLAVNGVTGQPSVRTIVRQKLEAGDQITLTFGEGLDLSGLATVSVGQAPVVGAGELGIDTGTADFEVEYKAADSDLANNVVVLEVKTGYTIELDESFEIVADAGLFETSASSANSTVTYSAASWQDGSAKDTTGDNTGTFLVVESQYASEITSKLDGVIERDNQVTFVKGADTGTTDVDSATFKVTDRQNYVGALNGADVTATFVIEGDFSDIVAGDITFNNLTGDLVGGDFAVSVAVDEKSATIEITDAAADGIAGTFDVTIDNSTRIAVPETIKVTSFTVDAEVDFDGAGTIVETDLLTDADAGLWMLDATIINIPYFPVGFTDLDTSVHFANEIDEEVNVKISAIDNMGVVYAEAELIDLAADTVTKVSQNAIKTALGIAAADSVKLSVTFNIDAEDGEVNAYAFSRDKAEGSRQALVTSQEKGIE
ncbi:hypothetical protein [Pseudoalteromonas mariniglutinosa]|uniref:hypothetical protein n=1 Tax=Pseudoalteromonas mariniglutinosa TaxID=206042 RepID=UPI00384FA6C1